MIVAIRTSLSLPPALTQNPELSTSFPIPPLLTQHSALRTQHFLSPLPANLSPRSWGTRLWGLRKESQEHIDPCKAGLCAERFVYPGRFL